MKVTILGCGASAGVPMIGCDCPVCTSPNPRNKRLRASLLVEDASSCLLVDASPDLRGQALTAGIRRIDGLVITHAHADHMHGLDDVRSFNYIQQSLLPLYADQVTIAELQVRFAYCFLAPGATWYRPGLVPERVEYGRDFAVGSLRVLPFEQQHGKIASMGIRIGDFAYSTDVNHLSEAAFGALEGITTWVVDCLSPDPTPTHAHLALTLEWIGRVQPKRAILTHMGHLFEYEALRALLPEGVEAAYDGMVIRL